MPVKKLTSVVIGPKDAQGIDSFLSFFNITPPADLVTELNKLHLFKSYSLEDQERFRIVLGEFVAACDHEIFRCNQYMTHIVGRVKENVKQLKLVN